MVDEDCSNCNEFIAHSCGAHGACTHEGLVDVNDSCYQFKPKGG